MPTLLERGSLIRVREVTTNIKNTDFLLFIDAVTFIVLKRSMFQNHTALSDSKSQKGHLIHICTQ